MVEALGNIELSSRVITPASAAGRLHHIDARYAELKTALKPIDVGSETHQLLAQYIANIYAATHSEYALELLQAFELAREGEGETFRDVGNRKLLWHGSRLSIWVGILSGGLRIATPAHT
ncbi:hypothetical protein AB1Y20_015410 [Prymnesium parvum]|uniref:Poly [ADP-ribose] polymerase n=1 Tax=Prymnesium parvum TaxID=97485 RepID=A0AB34K1E5_PRYPA|mmetsp:Transcript_18788/g.45051  ORF Transcript_18788/g.45051 Transcript_18788/m.45051 type:complete len:120 (+) Transcript_18788:63-422(+)